MKSARQLLNDSEGGKALANALKSVDNGGGGLNALFELIAQRARQEALEMAALRVEDCTMFQADRHRARLADAIRAIPTTPGDGEAGR